MLLFFVDPTKAQAEEKYERTTDEHGQSVIINKKQYEEDLNKSGYTREKAEQYWSNPKNSDPYSQASTEITNSVAVQAPRVYVKDNKIAISAPQEILDSPLVAQIDEELKDLKGIDLKSPELTNIINKLNEEIRTNVTNYVVGDTLGWTPEEYNDYQLAIQAVSGTNPMKSNVKLKWKKDGHLVTGDDGKVMQLTPKQWTEYWQTHYSADDRNKLFKQSLASSDPYERTMGLILSQGKVSPVYGFSGWEKFQQGVGSAAAQIKKLPTGLFRQLFTDSGTRAIEKAARLLNIPADSLEKMNIANESEFEKKKESIKGKTWAQLSDDDKAFLVILGNSKLKFNDRQVSDLGRNRASHLAEDLEKMAYENETVSRESINDILLNNSFDDYRKTRNDYISWQGYDKEFLREEEQLAENANWSGNEQMLGSIAGTIGRFAWENILTRGVTGGRINMNKISDILGEKIINLGDNIAKKMALSGIPVMSPSGSKIMQFAANLVGTIPEDIIQTSVDNVLTYNAEENEHLFDPDQMSENFKNNLIWMSVFNAGRAGLSTIKKAKILRDLAKQAELDETINVGSLADADDAARAINNGGTIEVDGDTTYIKQPDGEEVVLKNTDPETGKMAKKILTDQEPGSNGAKIKGDEIEAPKIETPETLKADIDTPKEAGDTKTIKVEAENPSGKVMEEVPVYNIKGVDDGLKATIKPTTAGLRQWHKNFVNAVMKIFDDKFIKDFYDRFGDVQASDFHWVRQNIRQGLSEADIIGTTDPTTGRVIEQRHIDAMKWWSEQPIVKDLRQASETALGKAEDKDILGYLPQSDYDPESMTPEEATRGVLWRHNTGKAVTKDGKYVGYAGDLRDRFRTFVSNMAWDAKSEDVIASKHVEEAIMDQIDNPTDGATTKGVDAVEPTAEMVEGARKAASTDKKVAFEVDSSTSTKDLAKRLSSESVDDSGDPLGSEKFDKEVEKNSQKLGLGKVIHDGGSGIYKGAGTMSVVKQRGPVRNAFTTLGDFFRDTVIEEKYGTGKGKRVSAYDGGAADIVYSSKNAAEFMRRWKDNGAVPSQFREMYVDFVMEHSGRSRKSAEFVADRLMARIGKLGGNTTYGNVLGELTKAMRSEGWTRFKRWLALADYDQFNASTKKVFDRFLFNHMQVESIVNNKSISKTLTKGLNTLTSYRYRSLFYGNIKNATLQLSELNRLFTVFKWRDLAKMADRLATDDAFRKRVDIYMNAVAPESAGLADQLYGDYAKLVNDMEVTDKGVTFKGLVDKADAIGLAPINAAENFKNRMMVAAILSEADAAGLKDNEALAYIRRKFERVALAADNELGRIGLASNPLARTALFLQNFQIRELGMHAYNIRDIWDAGTAKGLGIPTKVFDATKYLTKVFGSKLATALILGRLTGYSSNQLLGIDPFGMLDNYTGLSDDEMNELDKQISGGVLTPFLSGGMLSLFSDFYFAARKAYEESVEQTDEEKVKEKLSDQDKSFIEKILGSWNELAMPEINKDNILGTLGAFTPGSTFANRIGQMNDMMQSGWATSATGNKMYTAPNDAFNTMIGYLFGRSATENAQRYSQTYGDNLAQTWGRLNPFREYQEFDPIDTKNYSDWFRGDENDLQQFNIGKWYFRNRKNQIVKEYVDAINNANYDNREGLRRELDREMESLFDQLERFVDAYEKKNGMISRQMSYDILQLLDYNYEGLAAPSDNDEKYLSNNRALQEYTERGFAPIGNYRQNKETGETEYNPSPQVKSAKSGYFNTRDEMVSVLELADQDLAPLRKELQDRVNAAFQLKDWDALEAVQKEYLYAFDQAVGPIIAAYGVDNIKGSDTETDNVKTQLYKMLGGGSFIPSGQYNKNKYGRHQSVPLEEVNVAKWAKQRYSSDVFKNPTARSYSTAEEDIREINRLLNAGMPGTAKARAMILLSRVQNHTRTVTEDQYSWLNNIIENGGK